MIECPLGPRAVVTQIGVTFGRVAKMSCRRGKKGKASTISSKEEHHLSISAIIATKLTPNIDCKSRSGLGRASSSDIEVEHLLVTLFAIFDTFPCLP